jgi:carboxyl-terminal processing protease
MTQRIRRHAQRGALVAALAILFLVPVRLWAEPVPNRQDRLIVQLVCTFLQRGHLARPEINDELARRTFQRLFKDLDPARLYFLKSDIEELRRYEPELAGMLLKGDMSFAYKVYERFVTRIGERLALVEEFVKANHDFTVKEYLDTDFDKMEFAQSVDELRERWRKRIKADLLLDRVGKKPVPEAESKQKLLTRYQSQLKRWKQLDNYDLMELYLSDLTTSVDPHSSYMSPTTVDDFDIAMRLNLDGIGALLRSENGQTTVTELVPGGAAAADGRLKPNDKIVAVAQGDGNFVDVVDMKLRDVVKLIRGPRGTKLQMKVIPADKIEPIVIDLVRQKIELKSQEARYEIVEQGQKADGKPFRMAVIDLPSFYADFNAGRSGKGEAKSATEDVRKILNELVFKGVDGVILDLRRNGGGSLNEALALTGLFIDQGPIVQVKGSQGKVQRHDDPEKGMVYAGPLMVLVSKFSASASEILAGALQDYGRALIVGDSATHGKGTVQMVVDLGNQIQAGEAPKLGALKLTIQQFYRVNGDSTQNRGVVSDIVLPSFTEYLATPEKELDYALAFDKVNPVQHDELGLVPAEIKTLLKTRSAERVQRSPEFTKLIKEVDDFKARRARKQFPLNEQELRDQVIKEDAEKADQKTHGLLPPEPMGEMTDYKFQRNFASNEVLQIMQDFVQAKKLLSQR